MSRTEIGIAKDHDLNDADKKLLAVYVAAYGLVSPCRLHAS